MVSRKAPLEDEDVADIFEHQTLDGVRLEPPPQIDEDTDESALGGLISAEEHIRVRQLDPNRR